jgi:hypothetical protein
VRAIGRHAAPGSAPLVRKPTKIVAVALANKTACTVWAAMTCGHGYQAGKFSDAWHRRRPFQHSRVKRTDGERSSRGLGRPEEIRAPSSA